MATLTRLGPDTPSIMEKGNKELEDTLAIERKKLKGRQAKRFLMFCLAILLLFFGLKAVLGKATPQAGLAPQPVLESWPSKPKEVPKAAVPKVAVPKAAAPKAAAPKVAGKAEHHHAGAAGAPKAAVPKAAGKEAPTAEAKEGKGAEIGRASCRERV